MKFPEEKLCLSIIQSASDAIICKDLSGKILSFNPSAEKLFGYTENEVIDRNISLLVPPKKQEEEMKTMESLMWGETIENFETERLSKSGETISVLITLSPMKDDKGKTVGICSFLKNVSERKKAQGKSQAILESAPDAMVIVNKFGQIVMVNAQTEKLFGYSRGELIGKEVEILIPSRFKNKHPDHRKKYFTDPRARPMGQELELLGLRKDGTEFSVEISLSPLKIEEEDFVSAAIRDITEKKKTELHLKEYAGKLEIYSKELEQFAYVASHDLQEPLRNITNFVSLIRENIDPRNDELLDQYMGYVVEGSERMKALIKDLLYFSRIGRNRNIQSVDCNKVLGEIVSEMEPLIKHINASIKVSHLPTVDMSEQEVKQVFQNLLSNAIKFRKKDEVPDIKINVSETKNEWIFSVKDNGIGIDKEFQHKIFVIFQRLHNVNEYPGTGIGLATCKKIIEMNGGRIWLESEPGIGSTFYFSLPKSKKSI